MGRDKALAALAGQPMLVWTAAAMSRIPGASEVIVAGGDIDRSNLYARVLEGRLPIPVRAVADRDRDAGPIAGIEAAVRAATGDLVALAPVDSPLLAPELYAILVEECLNGRGAVPELETGLEPMNAVYRRALLVEALAGAAISAPREIPDAVGATRVHESRLREADEELLTFADADTPEELAELEDLIAARGGGATREGRHGLVDQAK